MPKHQRKASALTFGGGGTWGVWLRLRILWTLLFPQRRYAQAPEEKLRLSATVGGQRSIRLGLVVRPTISSIVERQSYHAHHTKRQTADHAHGSSRSRTASMSAIHPITGPQVSTIYPLSCARPSHCPRPLTFPFSHTHPIEPSPSRFSWTSLPTFPSHDISSRAHWFKFSLLLA